MSDAHPQRTADGAADRCPRCGGAFRCGMHEPSRCACTTVVLDDTMLAALNARYRGCLCLRCLAELAAAPRGPT
jgi:cysteine-rich CWC protein